MFRFRRFIVTFLVFIGLVGTGLTTVVLFNANEAHATTLTGSRRPSTASAVKWAPMSPTANLSEISNKKKIKMVSIREQDLQLRKGPGYNYDDLALLDWGDDAKFLGSYGSGRWIKVEMVNGYARGDRGYVPAKSVEIYWEDESNLDYD